MSLTAASFFELFVLCLRLCLCERSLLLLHFCLFLFFCFFVFCFIFFFLLSIILFALYFSFFAQLLLLLLDSCWTPVANQTVSLGERTTAAFRMSLFRALSKSSSSCKGVLLRTNSLRFVSSQLPGVSNPVSLTAQFSSAANDERPMQKHIRQTLTATFEPTHLEILNESHGGQHLESHFKVVIVADAFAGKPLLQQHRLVKAALQQQDGELPFHSLSIVSFAPDKWANDGGSNVPKSPRCAGGDGPK